VITLHVNHQLDSRIHPGFRTQAARAVIREVRDRRAPDSGPGSVRREVAENRGGRGRLDGTRTSLWPSAGGRRLRSMVLSMAPDPLAARGEQPADSVGSFHAAGLLHAVTEVP
jgi:hypothetical protein